jgi:hypothetical protein
MEAGAIQSHGKKSVVERLIRLERKAAQTIFM